MSAYFPIVLFAQMRFEAHPSGVLIVLRWQLGPMPVKCTCSAIDSTYILYGFLI